MKDAPAIARIAALIGEPARAELLAALMGGQALTATELAHVAGVTKQTISAHLAKLLDARLLAVESQGRHRYFRLADRDVARLLATLMGVAARSGAATLRLGPREPAPRKARVCYDHLAGELRVRLFDSLSGRRLLRVDQGSLTITPAGRRSLERFGIDLEGLESARRPLCRACLDWSLRRHHLAGALGEALLRRCYELGWARRVKGSRVVAFSAGGEKAFCAAFPASA